MLEVFKSLNNYGIDSLPFLKVSVVLKRFKLIKNDVIKITHDVSSSIVDLFRSTCDGVMTNQTSKSHVRTPVPRASFQVNNTF